MKGCRIILSVVLVLVVGLGLGAIIPAQISSAQFVTSQVAEGALLASPDADFLECAEDVYFSEELGCGDIIEWEWDVDPHLAIEFSIIHIATEEEEVI
jgi:hypothetical protein